MQYPNPNQNPNHQQGQNYNPTQNPNCNPNQTPNYPQSQNYKYQNPNQNYQPTQYPNYQSLTYNQNQNPINQNNLINQSYNQDQNFHYQSLNYNQNQNPVNQNNLINQNYSHDQNSNCSQQITQMNSFRSLRGSKSPTLRFVQDSRGVIRARCKENSCPCQKYDPADSIKCRCGHVPNNHKEVHRKNCHVCLRRGITTPCEIDNRGESYVFCSSNCRDYYFHDIENQKDRGGTMRKQCQTNCGCTLFVRSFQDGNCMRSMCGHPPESHSIVQNYCLSCYQPVPENIQFCSFNCQLMIYPHLVANEENNNHNNNNNTQINRRGSMVMRLCPVCQQKERFKDPKTNRLYDHCSRACALYRAPSPQFEGPSYWFYKQNVPDVQLVDCPQPIVEMVQKLFESTLPDINGKCYFGAGKDSWKSNEIPGVKRLKVTKVERVEYTHLWILYDATRQVKKSVSQQGAQQQNRSIPPITVRTSTLGQHAGLKSEINEVYLFHGTKYDAIDGISRKSLFTSKKGLCGSGAYFAESALKADEYARGDPSKAVRIANENNGNPQDLIDLKMFVCRVNLGCAMVSKNPNSENPSLHTLKAPPEGYDSIIVEAGADNTYLLKRYREFVIYDTYRAYPEYVVTYNREKN